MSKHRRRSLPLKIFTFGVYFFLWAPVLVVMVFSFSSNRYGLKWELFTLKWYSRLFDTPALHDALFRSLTIASVTVILSCFIGTLGAYGLFKLKFRWKEALRLSILIPIVLPCVVAGGSLLVFFTRFFKIPLGYLSIILAHLSFCAPMAVFIILGRMQRIDWAWEEAARDLGANQFRTFMRVVGPLMMPGIAAAALIIFPWSFDDFVITYFVSGIGGMTLPLYIYSQLRFGATPVINAVATILIITTVSLLLVSKLVEKKEKSI